MLLAFDIETSGLDAEKDFVTVCSTYDGSEARSYLFVELDQNGVLVYREDKEAVVGALCAALDAAPALAAFNGVRFDVPFIARAFRVEEARAAGWLLKCLDPFEVCKSVARRTFGLGMLLELNGMEGKSGSGLAAVEQARNGEFDALSRYCEDDARLTHEVCVRERLMLPEGFAWRRARPGQLHDAEHPTWLRIERDAAGRFLPFALVSGGGGAAGLELLAGGGA
jgi:hypothetical protein